MLKCKHYQKLKEEKIFIRVKCSLFLLVNVYYIFTYQRILYFYLADIEEQILGTIILK